MPKRIDIRCIVTVEILKGLVRDIGAKSVTRGLPQTRAHRSISAFQSAFFGLLEGSKLRYMSELKCRTMLTVIQARIAIIQRRFWAQDKKDTP